VTTTDSLRTETIDAETAADFVRRFQETWAAPTPERLNALVHPDIEFIQPLQPPVHGHAEAAAFWRHLLAMIPDLSGEVVSWAARDDVVFIELRMGGTLGGEPIEWVTLDRIQLDDGKVRRRIAYFDPLPLMRTIALRPRALRVWLRANAGRLMRR